jgi:hypothetical protein
MYWIVADILIFSSKNLYLYLVTTNYDDHGGRAV